MKKLSSFISALTLGFIMLQGSEGNTAEVFTTAGLGGVSGLVSTPIAETAWDKSQMAIDLGYHFVGDHTTSLPKVNLTLFGKWEIGALMDLHEDRHNDAIIQSKFCFYQSGGSNLAIGGNWQVLNYDDNKANMAYQIYLAATYNGNFFTLPAQTTLVVGKTLGYGSHGSNIDYSMGFNLEVFGNVFAHRLHWINDFANYSYSVLAAGANAYNRGAFNTGLRVAIFKEGNYKWNVDVIMTDALDSNRSWAIGSVFGIAIK